MNTRQKLSMATAGATLLPASWLHGAIKLCTSKLKLTTTVALLLAAVTPVQAAGIGFRNVTLNGVALEDPNGLTFPTITSPNGMFTFQVEVFNVGDTPPDPNLERIIKDIFAGKFYQSSGSTLNPPTDFSILYRGLGTPENPDLLTYTFNFGTAGTLVGALRTNFLDTGIDYDLPGDIDGIPDTDGRGFGFSLVSQNTAVSLLENGVVSVPFSSATAIPFNSSTALGLLIVSAWGAAYKLKKQKSPINKATNS